MRTSPSIVPADRLDPTSTLCSKTSARVPAAHDETDKADTDLEAVLQGLLSGQYAYQVRIVCFNAIEGWSRDATSDVADALARRTVDNDEEACPALEGFISANASRRLDIQLTLPLKGAAA